jgi:hypothetical protein
MRAIVTGGAGFHRLATSSTRSRADEVYEEE